MEARSTDILTFGETMLRFSPPGSERLAAARLLETWVSGCESNVAAAAHVLGVSSTWVSRLPDNALGQRIACELAARGVDTTLVVWMAASQRVGTFYFEPDAPPRPALTLYDRAGSAASFLAPRDLPDALFTTHRHLHVSGITPALSSTCAAAVADGIQRAKQHGMSVSLDVNYRAKLWSREIATAALGVLLPQVDIILCAAGDAAQLFGIAGEDALSIAWLLQERFGCPEVVVTAGLSGAAACLCDGEGLDLGAFPVESTVGRLGSGDAFCAGYLAGCLQGKSLRERLRLGAAMAALKRTIPGDMLVGDRREVEAILAEETSMGWR